MKHFVPVTLLLFFIGNLLYAQDYAGKWSGDLDLGSIKLPLVFNVEKDGVGYKSTMDSPAQGAKGIPVDKTTVSGDTILFQIAQIGLKYRGVLVTPDSLRGEFDQNNMKVSLNMKKRARNDASLRPQEPKGPFLYDIEKVELYSKKDSVKLAGVLTIPPYMDDLPAVILISGSGAQDKDCYVLGHKPFLVIADYLTRHGVAVLRLDDRGIGGSGGSLKDMTTRDISFDIETAYQFLRSHKRLDANRISLLGHSEGGLVAAMVAARDSSVASLVMMATPGVRGDSLLIKQMKDLAGAENTDYSLFEMNMAAQKSLYAIAADSIGDKNFRAKQVYSDLWDKLPASVKPEGGRNYFIASHTAQFMSEWFQFFIKYDPSRDISRIKCHVLCLNGTKDLQVNSEINQSAIAASLKKGGNRDYKVKTYEGLNHMFQRCETGHPNEYPMIQETINPKVLRDLRRWLDKVPNSL